MRSCESLHVIEDHVRRFAPAALLVRNRAPSPIALPHCPPDRCGNVAGTRKTFRGGLRIHDPLPSLAADAKALLLHLLDQQLEGLPEDGAQIPVGHAVPQQVLCFQHPVPEIAAGDELNLEQIRVERCEYRTNPPGRWRRVSLGIQERAG